MKKKYVPDLIKLGALHEGNYQRLCRLFHIMEDSGEAEFSLHTGHYYVGKVSIKMLESCKYTDTALLEQTAATGRWLNNPKMTVRLYHDAGVAEVISCCRHRRIESVNDYPNRFMHHPDEKNQINQFLSEWLNFCLAFGHCQSEQISVFNSRI